MGKAPRQRRREKDAKAGENPQPTPGGSGKLAGADSVPPPKANSDDGKSDSAAAGIGVAGGMVQSKQQHGQGKASGNDQRINDFQRDYEAADAEQKGNLKNEFKKQIDELKAKANKANGKERKKLLRRAEQWRGALKVITDGKVRLTGPLMLFNAPLMEKMVKNPLDEIPGIGPGRKRAILHHFGSAKQASRAAVDDLKAVDGISEAMAQQIYDHFQKG